MWLVPKVKLVVSIVLTALLTSVFLMGQVCLLESSCYRGLSEIAVAHRRALYRITGSQFLVTDSDLYIDSEPHGDSNSIGGTKEANVQQSMDHMYTSRGPFSNTPLPHISALPNETILEKSNPLVYEKPTITPSQKMSNVSHTLSPSPYYRVISKAGYAMFRYFQEQLSQQHCQLPKCMDRLSEFDKAWFDYCTQKKTKAKGKESSGDRVKALKGDCRFMRGDGRAPVALVSLPGSGNTWIRGLLEKATGICTGSIYCDVQLREAGFNGEEIRSGSVLVVKSHKASYSWTNVTVPKGVPSYGAVILLLRNPYHTLVAERNRKKSHKSNTKSSHTSTIGPEYFGTNHEWSSFVETKILKWKTLIENVILESPRDLPKLVVRYEDFQRDRVGEVSRVLDFLHFPYSRETLSQRLEEDFTTFRRNKHTEFEAFTQAQEQRVDHSLRQILNRLSARNNGETYGIEEYLINTAVAS